LDVLKEGDQITIDAKRKKILLGYDHELEVAGEDFDVVKDIKQPPFGSIRSSTIVATNDNALFLWALSKIHTYKGIGLKRLELLLAEIGVFTDALLGYDNMIRLEKGETLSPEERAGILDRKKDKKLIRFIEKNVLPGFNSAQDFYETLLREDIMAAAESLNPSFVELSFRYQQIEDKTLRLKVRRIVKAMYEEGLGHNSESSSGLDSGSISKLNPRAS